MTALAPRLTISPARIWLLPALLALAWPAAARADEVMRQVQEELRKRKVYFGDIDGRETREVRAALRHYQETRGLDASGRISSETLDTLDIAVPVGELGFPEGVVLRSDPGPGAESPVVSAPLRPAAPVITPAPTLPADDMLNPRAEKFIRQYLADSESAQLEAEVGHYAEQVDYFDHGEKPLDFVRKDVARYRKRWPERQFKLAGPVQIEALEEGVFEVRFQVEFEVKGPRPPARGLAEERFTIDTRGRAWRITGMKEERIRK